MKTLKFKSDDKQETAFSLTLRKRVHAYFKDNNISSKGNATMVVKSIVLLSLYLAPFILVMTVPMNAWIAFALMFVMGIGMAGVGMSVMHDAAHGSYSNKEWVNKTLAATMYLLGSNVFNWKIQHNVFHHAYTNIEGYDTDIESRGPIRLSQNAPLKRIHHNQHIHAFFFYGLMTLAKLTKDFAQLKEYTRQGITKGHNVNPVKETIKMTLVKIVYLFVFVGLPIIFTPFTWWQVLIGFFFMHWTGGCIMSTVFQMAHVVEGAQQPMPNAEGVIDHEWAVHQIHTTSDFARNSKILSWYVGGLNFQIEHHLFPNICHVHYKEIAPLVESTAHEFGLVYNLKPSFASALKSHVKRLRELEKV